MYGKDEKKACKMRKARVEKAGIDYKNFLAEKGYETNKWNALQWILYGEYLDKNSRRYWEGDIPSGWIEPGGSKSNNLPNAQAFLPKAFC